jgi:hypothetical protein
MHTLVGYLQQMCSDSSIATRYLLATECALCYSIVSIRAIALDLLNILLERISTVRDLIHLNTTPSLATSTLLGSEICNGELPLPVRLAIPKQEQYEMQIKK